MLHYFFLSLYRSIVFIVDLGLKGIVPERSELCNTPINNPSRPILSLSFKDVLGELITDVNITQTRLSPFFSNLLPEGQMRDYLAERANVNPEHEFFLLGVLGQDLPGALTIQPFENEPPPVLPKSAKLRGEKKQEAPLRFSLAGVQLKFSA